MFSHRQRLKVDEVLFRDLGRVVVALMGLGLSDFVLDRIEGEALRAESEEVVIIVEEGDASRLTIFPHWGQWMAVLLPNFWIVSEVSFILGSPSCLFSDFSSFPEGCQMKRTGKPRSVLFQLVWCVTRWPSIR